MVWKYKIVEFSENDWRELQGTLQAHSQVAEKRAGEILRSKHPDWDEKSKTLSTEEQEEILAADYYLVRNEIILSEAKSELGQFESVFLHQKGKKDMFPVSFLKYLELLINLHALEGWELDKVRNRKNSEMNGYLIFRKKE